MKPKDAFGHYGCVPRNLHPAWFEVSWSARALGLALFGQVDDFDTFRIDVHGDWRDSLCKRLAINGKERRYAKPALDALRAVGLVTVGDGYVVVNVRPVGADPAAIGLLAASDGTFKTAQVTVNIQDPKNSKLAIKQASESDAGAHTREARFEKPPVGEPPLGLPPPIVGVVPWLEVWKTQERMRGFQRGQLGHAGMHRTACESIAAAITAEVGGSEGVEWQQALERLLGAWLADKWVKENSPGIGNLEKRINKYARPKTVVKTAAIPYDWEAERDKRDREEEARRVEDQARVAAGETFWNTPERIALREQAARDLERLRGRKAVVS